MKCKISIIYDTLDVEREIFSEKNNIHFEYFPANEFDLLEVVRFCPDIILLAIGTELLFSSSILNKINEEGALKASTLIYAGEQLKHENKIRLLTSGINDFITLPVANNELIDRLETQYFKKQLSEENRSDNDVCNNLNKIIEDSLNEIYIFDKNNFQFLYANPAALKNLGYTMDELRELTPFDIKPIYDSDKFDAILTSLIENEINDTVFETLHLRKDKSTYPVEVHLQLLSYDNSPAFLAIILDITEKVKSIRLVNEKNKQWQTTFDSISDSIFLMDKDGTILQANKATYEIFNTTPSEFIGKKCYSVIHGKACRIKNCPFDSSWENKKRELLEMHTADKWFEITVDPIFDKDGEIEGAVHTVSDVTKRKLTENKLLTIQHDLKKAQEITHIGSWYLDVANNEVTWTEELYKMYGFDPSLPPPPFTEHMKLFTPTSWDLLSTSLENTRQTGVPYQLELETIRKDGTNGWMWVRGETVKDQSGKVIGIWGAAQDITDQKNSIDKIRKLSAAIEQSPLSIVITNLKGEIEYVNPYFTNITGYKFSEVKGKNPRILKSGETSKKEYAAMWKIIANGNMWKGEFHNRKKNGELYWESASISPIKNERGIITNYIAIKEDISRQKKLMNDLVEAKNNAEENEKHYRTLFESMLEGVYLHEITYDENHKPINYRIIEANAASEKHLSIKPSDAVGKLATELFHTQEAPLLPVYAKVAETGEPVTFERYFEPMNKYFHISVFSPQKGKFVSVFQDITKERKAITELEKAKEHAEESDRLKSAFLANMSHEIRTPLNGILGFTELLIEPGFEPEQKEEFGQLILENGELLMRIINDILDLSKIEAGQFEIDKQEFLLQKLIVAVKESFIPKALRKELELKLSIPKELEDTVLFTDYIRAKQILTNLVSNALKYTEKGSVEIGCISNDKHLTIYVKDTGIGIEKERLSEIFERFNRRDAYTKKIAGTGLGLAIAKNLIELLGGEIRIESEVGVGTCFYAAFPK